MSDSEEQDILTAEIMDRAERKALKEKLRKETKEAAAKNYGEIDTALMQGKLSVKRKAKKKLFIQLGVAGIVVALVFWIASIAFTPAQAGMPFGICKVYLENTVRFPQELRLTTVEDLRPRGSGGDSLGGVRIWYMQVGSFGEHRMENIECYFKPDETLGAAIDKIIINRREVDSRKVDAFNKVLPIIIANPPDLAYPPPWADSIEDLQFQTDSFRKRIL